MNDRKVNKRYDEILLLFNKCMFCVRLAHILLLFNKCMNCVRSAHFFSCLKYTQLRFLGRWINVVIASFTL